jgi:transcription elongation factor S-II
MTTRDEPVASGRGSKKTIIQATLAQKIDDPLVFRRNISQKIVGLLSTKGYDTNTNLENISINIEKSVYNFAIYESQKRKIVKKWINEQFVLLYIDRLRSIWKNMNSSAEFLAKIINGEILPVELSKMTHHEINNDKWNLLISKKIARDESKFVNRTQSSTDMFKCRKCHQSKCTYYSLQIRSADEPETIFVSCLNCGCNFTR